MTVVESLAAAVDALRARGYEVRRIVVTAERVEAEVEPAMREVERAMDAGLALELIGRPEP